MLALLEEARVVDDPRRDRIALLHRRDRVPCRREANLVIAPRRVRDEVMQALVSRARVGRRRRRTRGERLDALAFRLAQQPHRVRRERGTPMAVADDLADLIQVLLKPTLSVGAQFVRHARHAPPLACRRELGQVRVTQ